MRRLLPTYSAYPEMFRCLGSACEDTCCQGWNLPVDRVTYEKHRNLPSSPLSRLITASLAENRVSAGKEAGSVDEAQADNSADLAGIRVDGTNGCPMLTGERLCRIHAELGEGMLGHACLTFPRVVHEFGGLKETALALSCPEAERLVLLSPELPVQGLLDAGLPGAELQAPQRAAMEQTVTALRHSNTMEGANALPPNFIEIRKAAFALLRMRS